MFCSTDIIVGLKLTITFAISLSKSYIYSGMLLRKQSGRTNSGGATIIYFIQRNKIRKSSFPFLSAHHMRSGKMNVAVCFFVGE